MKLLLLSILGITLTACVKVQPPQPMSNQNIAAKRANIQALDNADYQTNRNRRQDAIEDLGTMQMNEAKAINKAYENISKQPITIIH